MSTIVVILMQVELVFILKKTANLIFVMISVLQPHADFECLSIELHNATQSNVVSSVFYKHPNSKVENFIEYYTKIMEKISNEKNIA